MKRVFSLLLFFVAAMSVQTVQAQTNGDVNGDGKVNEQDITAILEIIAEAGGVKEQTKYYWYVGQTEPTAENYTTLEGIQQVTAYPTAYTYTTAIRNYVYILVADNYTVSKIKDALNGLDVNYKEETSPITGYKLYKTAGIAVDFPITLQIKRN
mgnify:CR=1 FL=1